MRSIKLVFLVVSFYLLTACGGGGGSSNSGSGNPTIPPSDPTPVAMLTSNVVSGSAPLSIIFTDASTGATSCLLDFGDNTQAISCNQGSQVIHVYNTPGVYTAKLTASNSKGSDVKMVTITVTAPTELIPTIKTVGFPGFPQGEYTQKITVAFNEDFTSTHPDWKDKAQLYIDHYNTLLNRSPGNKKQIVIAQFKTYKNSDLPGSFSDNAYHYDNGYANGIAGGRTLFVNIFKNVADVPSYFNNGVGTYAYESSLIIGGKRYDDAFIANSESMSIFGSVPDSVKTSIPKWYEVMSSYIDHEFGHGEGLALDEWYQYEWDDLSGELPYLGYYNRRTFYPLDPMNPVTKEGNNDVLLQYSPINSWIINHNADGRYNVTDFIMAVPSIVKVRVLDAQGVPVSGAAVKVFAAVDMMATPDSNNMKSINLKTLLETSATNASGEALIASDFSQRYSAKGIKVAVGGKYAGLYITITDLQRAYLMQDLSINTMKGVGLIGVAMYNSDSVTYTLQLQ